VNESDPVEPVLVLAAVVAAVDPVLVLELPVPVLVLAAVVAAVDPVFVTVVVEGAP
jgi:hypothetical protein